MILVDIFLVFVVATVLLALVLIIMRIFLVPILAGLATADSPPPGSVRIVGASYVGDACPSGSVASMISPDGEAITLLFDSFLVQVNTDILGGSQVKQCEILLTLQSPQGWQFGIFNVDMRGYGSFDTGTIGKQWANYWLNGKTVSGVYF